MPFVIKPTFIDVFKIGDNINYNLEILKVLYEHYSTTDSGRKLVKPIVILNTSIAEAILYDFIENRIKRANPTEILHEDILELLNIKKLDKFEKYIIEAERYDFFNAKDTNFYNAMHSLRKKRNRIHIQNSKWEKPYNENEVFDDRTKVLSEKVLEKIIYTMVTKYPRREEYTRYVADFYLPWNKHFNSN